MKKIGYLALIILPLYAPVQASGIDVCSLEFLSLHKLTTQSQLKRSAKVARLEEANRKLKALKSDRNKVERESRLVRGVLKYEQQLLEGNFQPALDDWAPLFRNVEENFTKVKKFSEFYQALKIGRPGSPQDAIAILSHRFDSNPFALELLRDLSRGKFKSVEHMMAHLEKQTNKIAKALGKKYSKYKVFREQLKDLLESGQCNAACKKSLREFQRKLGIGSRDEQLRFPFLAGSRTPTLRQITDMVNSYPAAYETVIMQGALKELRGVIRDSFGFPKPRQTLASSYINAVGKVFPNHSMTTKFVDKVFREVESVSSHYPGINRILKSGQDIATKLDKLKAQNALYKDDQLMVTFARRVDRRASENWKDLKVHAKENDPGFYSKMTRAEGEGLKLNPLSADYTKGPLRAVLLVTAGIAGYQYLNLNFDMTTEETDELSDVIEVVEDENDPDTAVVEIGSEEVYELTAEQATLLIEAAVEAQTKSGN